MDDMNAPKSEIPTLAEWAGGSAAFEALTRRFYEKVPNDPVLAPVFATQSHPKAKTLSVNGFEAIAARAGIPVYALGGVTADNARQLAATNAAGIALIGGWLRS